MRQIGIYKKRQIQKLKDWSPKVENSDIWEEGSKALHVCLRPVVVERLVSIPTHYRDIAAFFAWA